MTESDLRSYAAEQSIDFDAMVAGASRHFQSDAIIRRTTPLTDEEVAAIVADDEASMK